MRLIFIFTFTLCLLLVPVSSFAQLKTLRDAQQQEKQALLDLSNNKNDSGASARLAEARAFIEAAQLEGLNELKAKEAAERTALENAIRNINNPDRNQSALEALRAAQAESTTVRRSAADLLKRATVCSGDDWRWSDLGICMGRWFSAYLGGVLVSITAWFLAVTGLLLNYVIDTTVISFGTSIYSKVSASGNVINLNTIWSFCRDMANIGILGIFTFIAISVIVGKTSFNNKRLVANVLIIALLINFSLLFAKMVVGTSNLFACQFYKAMVAGTVSCERASNTQPASVASFSQNQSFADSGLAGEFIQIIGIKGFSNTVGLLNKIADKEDNGFIALLHGVFTSFFLFLAIVAFGIIAVMLIVRAFMLLLLICIGPLAFMAYLVPAWSSKFKQWWEELIRQSFFAPVLLALLWMSTALAKGVSGGQGIMGEALANPEQSSSMQAIFLYLFVIGLLVASVFMAFRFASTISGMGWAPGLMTGLSALPVTGASLGVGRLLQNTLGRSAYLEKIRLDKKLDEAKNSGDSKAVLRVMKDMKSVSKAAGREYNAMNSFAPKTLEKVGLSGKWAMQTTKAGGFAGRTETKAKELSEEFKGSSLGGKNTETIKKNVAEAAHQNSPEFQEKSRLIKEQKKVVEEQLHATKTMRETAEKQLHLGEKEAAGAREQHTEEASTALKKAQGERDEALKSATTTDERKAVIDEHDNKVREIQRDLNTKIAESNKVAENARRELDIASRPVTLAKEALQKTEKEAEKLSSEIKKKAEIQSTKIIQSYNEGIQAAIVKKGGSPYVAKKVEKLWGDKNKQEQLKKRLQALELDDKIGAKQEKPEAH